MTLPLSARVPGLLLLLVSFVCATTARAQADYAAQKPAELLVFGGYNDTKPDFGATHNDGVMFGVEYDRSFNRWLIIPGLDVRATLNSGPLVSEHAYVFGPRLHMNLRRFHPYLDFEVGAGKIVYPEDDERVKDGGLVYSFGGGLDIDVAKGLALRADYQAQRWNLGRNSFIQPNGDDFTLLPTSLTIGFSYRIPFRNWIDQSHRSQ